jgi:hypothetical protein
MSAPCNYSPVLKRELRTCQYCHAAIAFVQNAKGKWYPVEVFPYGTGFAYRSGMGAHGNFTPWHKCSRKPEQV